MAFKIGKKKQSLTYVETSLTMNIQYPFRMLKFY